MRKEGFESRVLESGTFRVERASKKPLGEARGEDRRARRPRCSRRVVRCAMATSGLCRALAFGNAESFTVRKECSAALFRAVLVESMRMEMRAGEEAEVRVSCILYILLFQNRVGPKLSSTLFPFIDNKLVINRKVL